MKKSQKLVVLAILAISLNSIQIAQAKPKAKADDLAYSIGVGFIVIAIWLYTKVSSWTLAVGALTALGAGATEFVVETMENSLAAIVGMLLVGGIVTTIGIRAAGASNR